MRHRFSTAQAAKIIEVSKSTLLRWLSDGSLREPKRISIAGVGWRVWGESDIIRAQKLKSKMRPGPKSKKKK
jgi:excisionase family DNA binding protein